MAMQLSVPAILALKEALCSVYWYKLELRGFLQFCLSNPSILNNFNWENYKRQIASDVVDFLVANPDQHISDLTKLCYDLCKLTDFSHLKVLDDGPQKVERARNAVNQLRQLVEPHQSVLKEQDEIKRRRELAAKKLEENAAVRQKLEAICSKYKAMVSSDDPQGRGFELERVMYEVFNLFDLDPKASFRNLGEQIDGAFSLDGTEFLFEAKWHKGLVNKAELAAFSDKVTTKLENTLGIFLSINGFSPDGVAAHQAGGASILLMDGGDLMAILEERIDFVNLLLRKKRHAAQTGNIYLSYYQMVPTNHFERGALKAS
ncbi:MAG: restriction endonuclease [Nitrosomonas sp.]|uniref:restriction endonuclease n=1 Tax=Nitrosomonas sp. TaxID=42353 RepID=UPI00272EFF87|nr:restriction endonuclease [Nitrosomonas sp.]MDP1786660.1 restriction endonuclease [Nitrosomonas sp.]MDP3282247.1 restriction endonuclease [Nitrosomonas sp.]